MELALSLGDTPKSFSFLDKSAINRVKNDVGFCMGLGGPLAKDIGSDQIRSFGDQENTRGSSDKPVVQLDLLPLCPVPRNQPVPLELRLPWLLTHNLSSEPGSSRAQGRGAEVLNRASLAAEKRSEDGGASLSSPSTTISSFQNPLDLSVNRRRKRDSAETISICTDNERDTERRGGDGSSSRGSDHEGEEEEENGFMTRKKLRLSKEQSAFLEDRFREHNTLNPKQKLDLAKQLNLRSRQVEVWFQNRRARTKLKQTEVDCEYLKRCYETLTEENRRLQKEVHELKVLNTSQPFYNQLLPATTLTVCFSCERVASSTAAAAATAVIDTARTRH
ncbi:homeobox-leucine zipper protein HOX11 [Rhododendron vialii]|uniref:homeobox-leucine zipper protein HOX11 n=1 Tax=Rhododendron vialii TaxID=182163 RepID=UPI00265F6003|nr:homeobox-leucine zipper protein HOX11 [Rhododendron vialii]